VDAHAPLRISAGPAEIADVERMKAATFHDAQNNQHDAPRKTPMLRPMRVE